MAAKSDNRERLEVENRSAWREWLSKNYASSPGVWLIVSKKNRKTGVRLDDVVEEALCFGWIDSKLKPLNDESYMLLLTARKPKSIWSKSNKERVEKLMHQGLMTEAGLKKVETAKQNGSWSRLDAIDELYLPKDFMQALQANKAAKDNFDSYSASSKKQILWWIESARGPETRLKRIEASVAAAEKGKANL